MGPNSIAYLPRNPDGTSPEVGQLKPQLDIEGTLRVIEATISYLLSTKNLKTSTISGQLGVDNAASGISKAIDNAEVAEDKKEQQAYFLQFEEQIWTKLANYLIPYWRSTNQLNAKMNSEFTPGFTVNIQLREPKVMLTEKEQIEISKLKIDNGFSTTRRELYALYPDKDDSEIDMLINEIVQENEQKKQLQIESLGMEEESEEA